jgi:hypothetical protein
MGNFLLNGIWGDNPRQDVANWADENLLRNRTAVGLDVNGNLLPAPAPGTAPGVGSGQITGPPQDPTAAMAQVSGMMKPGQEPNNLKTPHSLGALLMAMSGREEAAAGLQQSLALAGAAISRPENRERSFKTLSPAGPPTNAMGLGQQLMSLSSQTQGQDRMNAIGQMIMDPQRGPALAGGLGVTWEELKARFQADPAGVGAMVQNYNAPTPDIANLRQIQRMQGAGTSNPTLNDTAASIVGKIGGQQAMDMAQKKWRDEHPGEPDSNMKWKTNDPASYAQYIANQEELNKSVATAAETHGHNIGMVTDMNNRIESVQKDPELKTLLNEPGLKKTVAKSLINDSTLTPTNILAQSLPAGISFSPGEMRVIDNLRQLKGGQYANALHALGLSRPSEREIEGINSGLGQITNLDLDYNTYKEQGLGQMGDMVKTMMGNSYGASQNFKDMPDYLKTYVDPQYVAGGTRALEKNGSEGWAGSTKMSPDEIKEAQGLLTSGKINPETGQPWTRRDVDRLVRSEGKRPTGY